MIRKKEKREAIAYAIDMMEKNHIAITEQEKKQIEIADFGLSNLKKEGLIILTYVNTKRACAKELIMYPNQTCPEHRHPSIKQEEGKEETFRCRVGTVYLYVDGTPTDSRKVSPPNEHYSVFHEIILQEGEQYTLAPNTLHWFQSGEKGAIVSEFSTSSHDEYDLFTNPSVERTTIVGE